MGMTAKVALTIALASMSLRHYGTSSGSIRAETLISGNPK